MKRICAVITVSDKDILSLKLNMPCSIPSMDSLSGKITRISVLPDTKSGLYDVDIIFPNSASLFPGKFVNIEILVNPVKGTYIPTSAVVSRYGKKLVFAIRNGTAEMLDITVLNIKGETTLVSGIPSGEHIAVSNTRMLIPGMQVEATPVDTSQLQ